VTTAGPRTDGRGTLIVDGANVVGSRPDGWWRDRAGAARRLLESLAAGREALAAAGLDRLVLVLEGAARDGAAAGTCGRVEVVHAAGSGDDEIVAQCEARGPGSVVVTADRALRQRVRAQDADVMRPSELMALLAEA
jgi:hypothetical protein